MDFFGGPADYTGQGTGSVVVEIPSGANGQQIANILKKAGVVKSAEAFYQLSLNDSRFQAVQAGFFKLRKQMSAEWAMRELTDRGNRVEGKVTIPEGARVDSDHQDHRQEHRHQGRRTLEAALDKPESLGLPEEANLNPEGFLYPATYEVPPGSTATSAAEADGQEDPRRREGARPRHPGRRDRHDAGRGHDARQHPRVRGQQDEDYPKVARVLLNRLDQADARCSSDCDRGLRQRHQGRRVHDAGAARQPVGVQHLRPTRLPPGPIGAAGKKTIEAALNPAEGYWLYFVPRLREQETVFSNNLARARTGGKQAARVVPQRKDTDDIC